MTGKIWLRESVTSKKFGVTFPANTQLHAYVDDEFRIFAEHPEMKGAHIRVSEMNVKKSEWNDYRRRES